MYMATGSIRADNGREFQLMLGMVASSLLCVLMFLFMLASTAKAARSNPICPIGIAYGDLIECSIDRASEIDFYTMTVVAGDRIRVRMIDTGDLWNGIRIYNRAGNQLEECTDSHPTMAEVECEFGAGGTYRIAALDGFNGTKMGRYYLYLRRLNPPDAVYPIAYGEIVTNSIDTLAQINFYSFWASSGDRVLIRMTNEDSLWSGIEIYDADGRSLDACTQSHPTTAELTCDIPSQGLYYILTMDGFNGTKMGTYRLSLSCLTPPCNARPDPQTSLVLIYAVLDNNLGDEAQNWGRLVNNAEAGVHEDIRVRLLLDGPASNDSAIYDLQADTDSFCPSLSNPTCNGRYVVGQNYWPWDEDTAHPKTLYNFVLDAVNDYPNVEHVILSLVGHGSGWSANALPGQPSGWRDQPSRRDGQQERIGGLLWDDAPTAGSDSSRSLSTKGLGIALDWIQDGIGRPLDLLYLDACSMSALEVAYEIRESVRYMLASPNTDWASFAYDTLLQAVSPTENIQAIGLAWLAGEAAALQTETNPFVLVLLDVSQINSVAEATSELATALSDLAISAKGEILEAAKAAERFESDYNGTLDQRDSYVDLHSLGARLRERLSQEAELGNALQALDAALTGAIVEHRIGSGVPWLYPNQTWNWQEAMGLSIYLPVSEDEPKRQLYSGTNLRFAGEHGWDDFLTTLWSAEQFQIAAAAGQTDLMPTCTSTRECLVLPEQLALTDPVQAIYLPMVSTK